MKFEERVREVEHSFFAPFFVSHTGSISPWATAIAIKRLGAMLAENTTPLIVPLWALSLSQRFGIAENFNNAS